MKLSGFLSSVKRRVRVVMKKDKALSQVVPLFGLLQMIMSDGDGSKPGRAWACAAMAPCKKNLWYQKPW